MSQYDVRCLEPSDLPAWDAMVEASPHATVFDESRWIQAMAEAAGTDIRLVGVFDGDSLVGGVHLQHRERLGMRMARGCRLSPTNSCVVRVPAEAPRVERERLVLEVTRALGEFLGPQYDFVAITNSPGLADVRSFRWLGWRTSVWYTYHVDLPNMPMARHDEALRRAAEEAGLSHPVMKDVGAPERFHALAAKASQHDGAEPAVSLAQLSHLHEQLPDLVRIRAGTWEDRDADVFGIVCVLDRKRSITHAMWAAYDPALRTAPVVYSFTWAELAAWREAGLATFDFVGADVEDMVRYKSEFEPRLVPYYRVERATPRYRIASRFVSLT